MKIMSDYISREEAIKAAEHAYGEWNLAMAAADGARQINLVYKRQELLKAVASVFDIVPAVDVEPVRHASWSICVSDESFLCLECSVCGRRVENIDLHHLLDAVDYDEVLRRYPYCHCGRKMDWGGENGNQ